MILLVGRRSHQRKQADIIKIWMIVVDKWPVCGLSLNYYSIGCRIDRCELSPTRWYRWTEKSDYDIRIFVLFQKENQLIKAYVTCDVQDTFYLSARPSSKFLLQNKKKYIGVTEGDAFYIWNLVSVATV